MARTKKIPEGAKHLVLYAHAGDIANPIVHESELIDIDGYRSQDYPDSVDVDMLDEVCGDFAWETIAPEFGYKFVDDNGEDVPS